MSDEEVIERLRDWPFMGKSMATAAADRIEALIAERDQAWKRAGHAEMMWGKTEVKLAKAVEAMREAIRLSEQPHYGDRGDALDHCFDAIDVLRTTLAELTGGKNG